MTSATQTYRFRSGLLRGSLAERRMTQEDLARLTGAKVGTVSRWCRELAEPRGYELVALSRVLGIPAADWYEQPGAEEAA